MANSHGQCVGGIFLRNFGKVQKNLEHFLHLVFRARPCPTTACFTWSAVYSETGRPALTAATMAAPRACPSFKALCALLARKIFSTETTSGRYCSMISVNERNIFSKRNGKLPIRSVWMAPLSTWISRFPFLLNNAITGDA